MSVQLYDAEAGRFQEWVPSASFFPAYVQLLYAAANPVLGHPLADLLDPESEGREGDEGREGTPEEKASAAFAAAQSGVMLPR